MFGKTARKRPRAGGVSSPNGAPRGRTCGNAQIPASKSDPVFAGFAPEETVRVRW